MMKLISWLENRPKRMLQEVYVGRVLGGASEIDAMSHYNLIGFRWLIIHL